LSDLWPLGYLRGAVGAVDVGGATSADDAVDVGGAVSAERGFPNRIPSAPALLSPLLRMLRGSAGPPGSL